VCVAEKERERQCEERKKKRDGEMKKRETKKTRV
jgi:hypothetical protein